MRFIELTKKELKILFYSPVGFLILAVFSIQSGSSYFDILQQELALKFAEVPVTNLTSRITTGQGRFIDSVLANIYLYIPLLTMGVFSRELQEGSIKLLMSSPIRTHEIVFGKYIAVVIYIIMIMAILLIYGILSYIVIQNMDIVAYLTAVFGVFMLACFYASIGVFVSSLSKYQVVSAIVTLAILFLLSSMGGLQAVPVLGEVINWTSSSGRADWFRIGLITSDNIIYFLVFIMIFLVFTTMRIADLRSAIGLYKYTAYSICTIFVAVGIGIIASVPQLTIYIDATREKNNTLSETSQAMMARMQGPWRIDTYSNIHAPLSYVGFPSSRISERERLRPYTRFNHELELNSYIYYNPEINDFFRRRLEGESPSEIAEAYSEQLGLDFEQLYSVDELQDISPYSLAGEEYRTFRVLSYNGSMAPIRNFDDNQRFATEVERMAAVGRVLDGPVTVAVAQANGERSISTTANSSHEQLFARVSYRWALINQGYVVDAVDLRAPVSANVDILVLADPASSYSSQQLQNIFDFIESGRNLFLAVEPDTHAQIDRVLEFVGLRRGGELRQLNENLPDDHIIVDYDLDGLRTLSSFSMPGGLSLLPGAVELAVLDSSAFEHVRLLSASNTTGDSGSPQGEVFSRGRNSSPTLALGLERSINGRDQRIIVVGDADYISNAEVVRSRPRTSNLALHISLFRYLSNDRYPVKLDRPPSLDRDLRLDQSSLRGFRVLMIWLLPALIVVIGASIIHLRRRR